ncbi:MAG: N-formylglutamate amidohydrolase, partial [Acidobacteria bacterium]|nr:N-formylglutamate amidohydrolase [Acidobacteriota bacterium]
MSEDVNDGSEIAQPYYLDRPGKEKRIPMILSIPHAGTGFPPDLVEKFDEDILSEMDDTDWNLDQLYDFAPEMGVTVIHAKYSRWVIDLNREPNSKPLYDDGRLITALCPTTDFLGADLYTEKEHE